VIRRPAAGRLDRTTTLIFEELENLMALTLSRPRERWIAGVCSGLARRFAVAPKVVRLAFVLSCLLPGPQFVAYLALWVLMPSET
jgi:phage shock protein PspC (stress-responsive transcriptional regulator)